MKFTLKDYQRDAVRDALDNLKDAQDDWRRKSRLFVVCLRYFGMTDILGIVYPSGFSEDTDRQTKWEQSSRWGFWGTRDR